jgi:hypothetical protein
MTQAEKSDKYWRLFIKEAVRYPNERKSTFDERTPYDSAVMIFEMGGLEKFLPELEAERKRRESGQK